MSLNTLRSKKCEEFLRENEVNCCSIAENDDEGHFSWSGCECCNNRLGTTVYTCNGYSPEHGKVFDLGEICGDCIAYFYNGDDSEIEKYEVQS